MNCTAEIFLTKLLHTGTFEKNDYNRNNQQTSKVYLTLRLDFTIITCFELNTQALTPLIFIVFGKTLFSRAQKKKVKKRQSSFLEIEIQLPS